jgi:hypothetical protein
LLTLKVVRAQQKSYSHAGYPETDLNRVARWFILRPKIHFLSFMSIWANVWLYGVVCGPWVYFSRFWYVWAQKNLATLLPNDLHQRPCLFGHVRRNFCGFYFVDVRDTSGMCPSTRQRRALPSKDLFSSLS